MKLLVSGCSITAGFAFNNEKKNPDLWCNRLATYLNADITNIAQPGLDNTGIFVNTFDELIKNDYDLAVIQVTGLTRLNITPTNHGFRPIDPLHNENIAEHYLSDKEWNSFRKNFLMLNGPLLHWERLIKLLNISQGFNTRVLFVNGLLSWTKDFFNQLDSSFHRYIISESEIPESEIPLMLDYVNKTKKEIDVNQWLDINPMTSYKTDTANDKVHFGSETHKTLFDRIKEKI